MVFEIGFEVAQAGVDLGAALGEQEILTGALVHVPTGEDAEGAIARLGHENMTEGVNLMQEVAMGQHGSFRTARGSGGVDEGGQGTAIALG